LRNVVVPPPPGMLADALAVEFLFECFHDILDDLILSHFGSASLSGLLIVFSKGCLIIIGIIYFRFFFPVTGDNHFLVAVSLLYHATLHGRRLCARDGLSDFFFESLLLALAEGSDVAIEPVSLPDFIFIKPIVIRVILFISIGKKQILFKARIVYLVSLKLCQVIFIVQLIFGSSRNRFARARLLAHGLARRVLQSPIVVMDQRIHGFDKGIVNC